MSRPTMCYGMLSHGALDSLQQLGNNLMTARFARNWSRAVVAEKIGVSLRTVKKAEDGAPNAPAGVYVALLALYEMDDQLKGVACPSADYKAQNFKGRRAGRRTSNRKDDIVFDID